MTRRCGPEPQTIHTYPLGDLIEHELTGTGCACGPDVIPSGPVRQVIHHSLDGREHDEPDHDHDACPLCSEL
jgi:hypothetical protein